MKRLLPFLFLVALTAQAQLQLQIIGSVTNLTGPLTFFGDSNKTNGTYIGPTGEVLSNALGSVTIAGGTVTASGTFTGNGSGLTNINATSVIGTITPTAAFQSNTTFYCNLSKNGIYIINPTTNNIQFIATGMVAGASCDILLFTSTTNCTLSFDSSLTNFIGVPAPTLLSSNHVGELKLKSWDTTAGHVTLYWGSTVP